jgi:hypothetical protein
VKNYLNVKFQANSIVIAVLKKKIIIMNIKFRISKKKMKKMKKKKKKKMKKKMKKKIKFQRLILKLAKLINIKNDSIIFF